MRKMQVMGAVEQTAEVDGKIDADDGQSPRNVGIKVQE